MAKIVVEQYEWDKVYKDLENEVVKTSTYDNYIIQLMGDVKNKKILDYGCGPGIIAKALHDFGAIVDVYDINEQILRMANKRIESQRIFNTKGQILKDYYDFILCNLVVCIVNHDEVFDIAKDIFEALVPETGVAYVGFCNPLIFNYHETKLDIRHSGNMKYDENHMYYKEKKEGGYVIPEMHRPIEWYDGIFSKSGLKIEEKFFTPEYTFNTKKVNDFIIFKLTK
ncbi:MAG: class I SAM-dependent methyltransferase [Candidatus Thorarchaeota archaeon]